MKRDIVTSVIGIIVFTILLGLVYPLVITGVSQVAFPGNANGQKVYVNGKLVGSKIIGQNFGTPVLEKNGKPKEVKGAVVTEADPRYFQTRPSATEGGADNAAASTFSNHGPNSVKTKEADEENIKAYLELNKNPSTKGEYDPGLTVAKIPVDAVNTLGLGPRPRNLPGERLDPGAPHRGRAPPLAGDGRRADLQVHVRPRARLLRRTRRERARAQPRPRPWPWAKPWAASPVRRNGLMSAQIPATHERQAISLFQRDIVGRALIDSLKKLDPRVQIRNPVMFVVEIGSVITTVTWLIQVVRRQAARRRQRAGVVHVHDLDLAVADGRLREHGRGLRRGPRPRAGGHAALDAQGDRRDNARRLHQGGRPSSRAATSCVVAAGELIPGDGTVIEGIATVDESAITGESAPVIRESGGDRSAVTGGTRVTSDEIVVEITQEPGQSFLDRMIALVEGAERRKTPNEIALNILLAALTLIFMIVVATLRPFGLFAGHADLRDDADRAARRADPDDDRRAAVGDRHRRHGPPRAPQRARAVRPRGRGLRATSTCCCSTRPARSRSATAWRRSSSRCRAWPSPSSPRSRSSPRSPTRRPRAARSSCWPSSTASASTTWRRCTPSSCRSPRRRG